MRILFPPFIMLIAGLSIGAASTTLLWSSKIDRGFQAQAEWKQISDKFEAIAKKNEAGWRECLTIAGRR